MKQQKVLISFPEIYLSKTELFIFSPEGACPLYYLKEKSWLNSTSKVNYRDRVNSLLPVFCYKLIGIVVLYSLKKKPQVGRTVHAECEGNMSYEVP